jgi:predicted dehydrogenase
MKNTPSSRSAKLRVAVVGLRFGSDFVPIYQKHPDVASVAICDASPEQLQRVGDRFGITERFTTLEEILALKGPEAYDAVHLVTPVGFHAQQTLAVLEAGKHCACAVPMATTEEDLRTIIATQKRTGKNYMMMETSLYTREFLYVQGLYQRGELGGLTFLRGVHIQNIEQYPEYWRGYPPMHYITHAISPLLTIAGTRAEKVFCLGSGTLRPDLQSDVYKNPFPLESALFRLKDSDVVAEVTMSFFQVGRQFKEGFDVYGDKAGFEWEILHGEPSTLFRLEEAVPGKPGRAVSPERIHPPYRPDLLPEEIAEFTSHGGHGGSHPHLVQEFIRSIVEERTPRVDTITAANWTVAGLCAHQSALQGGDSVTIPAFD